MSNTINLTKQRAEQVTRIVLDKSGLSKAPIMRVCAAFDISVSMRPYYAGRPSLVQQAFDRLMGVSLAFDDDGNLDLWQFDDSFDYIGTATINDVGTYVDKNLGIRGATSYAPVLNDIVGRMFGGAPAPAPEKKGLFGGLFGSKPAAPAPTATVDNTPVLVLFQTDGVPNDMAQAKRVIEAARNRPIYFEIIGLNRNQHELRQVQKLADDYDNVGYVGLTDLDLTDAQLYDALINPELIEVVRKFAGTNGVRAATA